MRVLIFGDSIVQGFSATTNGWVDLLRIDQSQIDPSGIDSYTVFNLGISAETTEMLLGRINNEIIARQFTSQELLIVIATGTNDAAYGPDGDVSTTEEYLSQISKIQITTAKYAKHIIYVGMIPVIDELVQPLQSSKRKMCFSNERAKTFNATVERYCHENELNFVSVWGLFEDNKEQLLYDGLHPNDKGHKVLYSAVKKKIEEII